MISLLLSEKNQDDIAITDLPLRECKRRPWRLCWCHPDAKEALSGLDTEVMSRLGSKMAVSAFLAKEDQHTFRWYPSGSSMHGFVTDTETLGCRYSRARHTCLSFPRHTPSQRLMVSYAWLGRQTLPYQTAPCLPYQISISIVLSCRLVTRGSVSFPSQLRV